MNDENDNLIMLAKRSNVEQMSSVNSFIQGFVLGRNFQRELQCQIYNEVLRETHASADIKFTEDNWWDNKIKQLELDIIELKKQGFYDETE